MIHAGKAFINLGPGDMIRYTMESLNWSQEDLAEILGMSSKSVSLILNNKQSITVESARLLAKAFGTSAEMWLNAEKAYRLRLSEEGQKERDTQVKAEIRKHMPILQMKKKGWLSYDRSAESQIDAYCKFWDVKEPEFDFYEAEDTMLYARRNSEDENYTKFYTRTWLRKAIMEAQKVKTPSYNRDRLATVIQNYSLYSRDTEGAASFVEDLIKAGLKFFILSHLDKTYLDGAAFVDNGHPVVIFTGRHKNIDSFWWTMAHELGHVMLHLDDDNACFLDDLYDSDHENKKEREADQFARRLLKVEDILKAVPANSKQISSRILQNIADKVQMGIPVVLGILQFEGIIPYRSKLNDYKYSALDTIPDSLKIG